MGSTGLKCHSARHTYLAQSLPIPGIGTAASACQITEQEWLWLAFQMALTFLGKADNSSPSLRAALLLQPSVRAVRASRGSAGIFRASPFRSQRGCQPRESSAAAPRCFQVWQQQGRSERGRSGLLDQQNSSLERAPVSNTRGWGCASRLPGVLAWSAPRCGEMHFCSLPMRQLSFPKQICQINMQTASSPFKVRLRRVNTDTGVCPPCWVLPTEGRFAGLQPPATSVRLGVVLSLTSLQVPLCPPAPCIAPV